MKIFLAKPYRWAGIFSVLLTASVTFTMLDTFVLEKSMVKVLTSSSTAVGQTTAQTTQTTTATTSTQTKQSETKSTATITGKSYKDENIKITIDTVRKNNTTMYVADIQVSDVSYLKTALTNDTYGRNITAATSTMAKAKNAIFAINGDYCGFRTTGYALQP
jgi:hypothetical protein